MGNKDQAERILLRNAAVFADACNYALFGGKDVIKPDSLREQDSSQIAVLLNREMTEGAFHIETGRNDGFQNSSLEGDAASLSKAEQQGKRRKGKRSAPHGTERYVDRTRDVYNEVAVMSDGNTTYVLLGIEAQAAPNREMAVRVMMSDAMSYSAQTRRLRNSNRAAGRLEEADYIGGLLPEDRIRPVITLVILFSAEGWNVPRSLSDLFEDYDPRLEPYIQDYHMNLIAPSEITDFDVFRSSLGPTLAFMKYSNDKEAMKQLLTEKADIYRNLDSDAARVLEKYAKINVKELNDTGTETEVNMCKAWDDYAKEVADDAVKKVVAENEKVMAEKEKEWQDEYKSLATENSNLSAENSNLSAENSNLTAENSNLSAEITRLQQEVARLQQA